MPTTNGRLPSDGITTGQTAAADHRAPKLSHFGLGDHRHAVGGHWPQILRRRRERPAVRRAREPELRHDIRGERAAFSRRDRQGIAVSAPQHRDAQERLLQHHRQHDRCAQRHHRRSRHHRCRRHIAGIERRPAADRQDGFERPGSFPVSPHQHRRSALHQQAGDRSRERPVVDPDHATLPQSRRQLRWRRGRVPQAGLLHQPL